MSSITVIGGTGYAGSRIVAEAAGRGHAVKSISRTAPAEPLEGVDYRQGSIDDPALVAEAVEGADVVVAALSPRGEMSGRVLPCYRTIAGAAANAGARLIVMGGFSALRPAPGAPRFAEGDVPEQFRAEALEMVDVLDWLNQHAPEGLDWTFVSPAGDFGAYSPGERKGRYRIGGEVALFDAAGVSALSGEDLAIALVDEIERHRHRGHIGVAY